MALAKKNGARIKVIARPDDHDWTSRILDGIDKNTAVVALANCLWTDGSRVDLVAVGEKARAVGAGFVVDGTQSVGAMGCDVCAIKPDFLVVSSYKWLFGPYSLGFLYADKRHHGGEPLEYNWITRAGSEDFSNLIKYTEEYHDGARRFDMGARSHINIIPMAIPALEQLIKWDPEYIQKTLSVMTDAVEENGKMLGLIPVPKKYRVGHIVGLRFPKGVPQGLIDQLHREKIFISVRDDAIRVSPHLYNSLSEVERLFSVMKKFF
jgi:selenocysteine lyase/cysteine desulfurase